MDRLNKLDRSLSQPLALRRALRKVGLGLAGLTLFCLALISAAQAQTSMACDPGGDASYGGSGQGGPAVPPWLDITQATIADAGDSIVFTLMLDAPISMAPAWQVADDGGMFQWGWRLVGDIEALTFVRNGCVLGKGHYVPAAYFLDLVWRVQTATFRARLLDDTSCTESEIPFVFSLDRRQVSLLVSKDLFANATIIPNPNTFQYFATTVVWKANKTGNSSFFVIDHAPDQSDDDFVVGTWSSSSTTTYGCP